MSAFSEKVVWITGASSGIGEALAIALGKVNAKLVLSARRADELERVASQTGLSASHLLILPMDMTHPESFAIHTETVIRCFGRIDYVFQNAGLTQRSSVLDTDFRFTNSLWT